MSILEVNNLHASLVEDMEEILKGVNLTVGEGEVHAIMGPNGSGKSTFANVLMGNPKYSITSGTIKYRNAIINNLTVDERARLGIFMSFQHPEEVTGVRFRSFMIASSKNLSNSDSLLKKSREIDRLADEVSLDREFMDRYLNAGFSGGEKKKAEIIQMNFLKPGLAILDEIDSGLDVDALKSISNSINKYRALDNAIILITHYQRLLDCVVPNFVHVYVDGSIVATGGPELAKDVESGGYERYVNALREVR